VNITPSVDIYVPINNSILVLIEEIKDSLEKKFLIQATQQDIIENAIILLSTQYK